MIGSRPICEDCKHLRKEFGYKCDAFPEGIPEEIVMGDENIHKKPYKGDQGIQYEPVENA